MLGISPRQTFDDDYQGFFDLVASQVAAAIAALKKAKPDIILSDMGMPDVDGYALMRRVRSLSPEQGGEIPAIALTAYASKINYQQSAAAGFQTHMA
ncbi:MAG: response regulator, partial [Phormidesmis sp.]